jgi:UDP-N-acetylmuramoyl-tripeptide--D-alanyl-D-alanine ligase
VALKLALPGRHNLHNALAAIAVAEALALNVCQLVGALSALTPVRGRLYPLPGPDGACIIDDSYNANPDSLNAALQVMEALPGPGWLVLGDLAELGADARSLHHALGVKARQAGVERLWAVGDLSREAVRGFGSGARHFTDKKALVAALEQELTGEDVILVKGSRSAAMDQVVSLLTHSGER